jgi:hypothetical protein
MKVQKIMTRSEQEKKNKRNQLIIGIVLIGLMLLSTAGYALTSNEKTDNSETQKIIFNEVEFIKNYNYWIFNFNGKELAVIYNPKEVQDIKVLGGLTLDDYKSKPLYFSGENQEAIAEIARNINQDVLRVQKACTADENCTGDYPVKECTENLIIIKEPDADESESIYRINNCAYIIANSTNQIKYADAFLFKLLKL